jgi:hypothetical protein
MQGDLVVVYKNKQGERLIDEAIRVGIKGMKRHFPDMDEADLDAWVGQKLFDECELTHDNCELRVDVDKDVPYPCVWVCRKESVHV